MLPINHVVTRGKETFQEFPLLPGEGVINLTGFLRAVESIRYNDALRVEVFGQTRGMTPDAAANAGLDMRACCPFVRPESPRRTNTASPLITPGI